MKHASLLIALCVLFSLTAVAQSTTPVVKNTKRITITSTKVDDNGKTITETWIAEGNEPAKILEEMAINPEMIQKVEIESHSDIKASDAERLFLFRSAGDKVAVEGTLNESTDPSREVIIITSGANEDGNKEYTKISRWHGQNESCGSRPSVQVGERKSNCAALGVWANNTKETQGARINGLIDNGGAQEAGLKEGDRIQKIDEFDVNDFTTLHLALSHFEPGDRVTVRYERDGKALKAKVNLKDWAELPGHEYRSRSDCGKQETPTTNNTISEDPSYVSNLQPLELNDAQVYPNPTDGVFALSFTTAPGPISVAVTDVNGKVVYHENNENGSGAYNREIDLKALPLGNYIISVTQKDKVYTQQISKQ